MATCKYEFNLISTNVLPRLQEACRRISVGAEVRWGAALLFFCLPVKDNISNTQYEGYPMWIIQVKSVCLIERHTCIFSRVISHILNRHILCWIHTSYRVGQKPLDGNAESILANIYRVSVIVMMTMTHCEHYGKRCQNSCYEKWITHATHLRHFRLLSQHFRNINF